MTMFDPFAGWSRLMMAGRTMTETSLRAVETVGAANAVIGARSTIIDAAMRSPLTGDHAELARMVPEKVEAFSRAGSAAVTAWWAAQSVWMEHMQHVGSMALRGRPPTIAEVADLGSRVNALALESIEAAAGLGSSMLAPVHREATSNARRLKRGAEQTRRRASTPGAKARK
jgi:hypothetical protein